MTRKWKMNDDPTLDQVIEYLTKAVPRHLDAQMCLVIAKETKRSLELVDDLEKRFFGYNP